MVLEKIFQKKYFFLYLVAVKKKSKRNRNRNKTKNPIVEKFTQNGITVYHVRKIMSDKI